MFQQVEVGGPGGVQDASVERWVKMAESQGAEFQSGFVEGLAIGRPNLATLVQDQLAHSRPPQGIQRTAHVGDGQDRVRDVLNHVRILPGEEARGVLRGAIEVLPANYVSPLVDAYRALLVKVR